MGLCKAGDVVLEGEVYAVVGNLAVVIRKVLVAEVYKWGYISRNKLVEVLNIIFWWKGLIIMVKEVVENCLLCK